ncbi:MAG: hypothetical protein LBL75_04040 [Rickettsiales bacterium]|jgi:FMN phosphatase YigB (HAD superfamily)|nr:hypothetical protein [Rickettsiales bacterium]
MIKITIDLDDTIFNLGPIFQSAANRAGVEYTPKTYFNVYDAYPKKMARHITSDFYKDKLYKMPLCDAQIPYYLNQLFYNPNFDVHFVTTRKMQQPQKTYMQLLNAGIMTGFNNVHDVKTPKIDTLVKLGTDLHIDDSPFVITDCIEQGIPVIMISNSCTHYNHELARKLGPDKTAFSLIHALEKARLVYTGGTTQHFWQQK